MGKLEEITELIPVYGFKLINATTQLAEATVDGKSAGTDEVVMLEFLNDNHVKIDVYIIDGDIQVDEPYAVNADMKRLD